MFLDDVNQGSVFCIFSVMFHCLCSLSYSLSSVLRKYFSYFSLVFIVTGFNGRIVVPHFEVH